MAAGRPLGISRIPHKADLLAFYDRVADLHKRLGKVGISGFCAVWVFQKHEDPVAVIPSGRAVPEIRIGYHESVSRCRDRRAALICNIDCIIGVQRSPVPPDGRQAEVALEAGEIHRTCGRAQCIRSDSRRNDDPRAGFQTFRILIRKLYLGNRRSKLPRNARKCVTSTYFIFHHAVPKGNNAGKRT